MLPQILALEILSFSGAYKKKNLYFLLNIGKWLSATQKCCRTPTPCCRKLGRKEKEYDYQLSEKDVECILPCGMSLSHCYSLHPHFNVYYTETNFGFAQPILYSSSTSESNSSTGIFLY